MGAIFKIGNIYFDIVSILGIIFIIFTMIKGYKKGLIYNVINSIKGIVSLFIAYSLKDRAFLFFKNISIFSNLNDFTIKCISFIGLIITCFLIFSIILHFAKKINKDRHIGKLNQVLGLLLGLIVSYISFDLLIYFLTSLIEISDSLKEGYSNILYLNNPEIFTFSKFVYNNNITKIVISALLS